MRKPASRPTADEARWHGRLVLQEDLGTRLTHRTTRYAGDNSGRLNLERGSRVRRRPGDSSAVAWPTEVRGCRDRQRALFFGGVGACCERTAPSARSTLPKLAPAPDVETENVPDQARPPIGRPDISKYCAMASGSIMCESRVIKGVVLGRAGYAFLFSGGTGPPQGAPLHSHKRSKAIRCGSLKLGGG